MAQFDTFVVIAFDLVIQLFNLFPLFFLPESGLLESHDQLLYLSHRYLFRPNLIVYLWIAIYLKIENLSFYLCIQFFIVLR